MTPDQLRLARHALGLPNDQRRSYRNYYVAALHTLGEMTWDDLVRSGMAERGENRRTSVGFCLTDKGAAAALEPGETLDPEDFPPR